MLDTLVILLLGAFIGWNFPQPFWAVWIQNWAAGVWAKITKKNEG